MNTVNREAYDIFVAALDLDEVERVEFVSHSCGSDRSLVAAVERLLAAVEKSAAFLESSAVSSLRLASVAERPVRTFSSDAIEGLTILRRLGAGGMAEVYEAKQESPRRQVAVKILHGNLSDTSAVQRFHFEADTLAKLNHPGIAQIFRSGTCRDSLGNQVPFFAMEYIPDASTIVQYAIDRRLSVHERLNLFAEATDAVQFGHQAGIVHRDLKPANILVDTEGRPRIIDFGVAKAADPDINRTTISQDSSSIVGTLNYMSPEQCAGSGNVDTRADVYSLGVVLYELLTESRPYDLSSSSILEAVRTVQFETPALPSDRAATVPRELNAIVLKALEKEPDQRYATASELAADVRRFLDNRPILARPPSTIYQLRKFSKRNPALVTALSAVAIALVGGITATSWMAHVAAEARDQALENASVLERVVEFQQSQLGGIDVAAMGAQLRAALLDDVRKHFEQERAIDSDDDRLPIKQFEQLVNKANFTTLTLNTLQKNMLDHSIESVNAKFADQPCVRAESLQTIAITFKSLGRPQRAEPILRDVLQIRQQLFGEFHDKTIETKYHLGIVLSSLGRLDESQLLLSDVLEHRRKTFGPEDPHALVAANGLAGVYRRMGQQEKAMSLWKETWEIQRRVLGEDDPDTIATLNNIGVILSLQGKSSEAEAIYREVAERTERIFGAQSPKYQNAISNLGMSLVDQGKPEAAQPLFEESLKNLRAKYGDDHPSTLLTMGNVAMLRLSLGDISNAKQLLDENYESRRRVLGEDHPNTLRALASLAMFYHQAKQNSEAETAIRNVIDTQRRVLGKDHIDLCVSTSKLATWLHEQGRFDEAEEFHLESLRVAEGAVGSEHSMFGESLGSYGEMLLAAGREEEAEAKLQQAHKILSVTYGPTSPAAQKVKHALASLAGTEYAENSSRDSAPSTATD